jgi:hypothetical protein
MDDGPVSDSALDKLASALDKLAELAQIPPGNRAVFGRCTRADINELCRGMAVHQPPCRRDGIVAALDEYQAAVGKLRELLTPEHVASTRVDACARTLVLASLSKLKRNNLPEFLDEDLLVFDDLAIDACARSHVLASLNKLKRGYFEAVSAGQLPCNKKPCAEGRNDWR